MKLSKLKESLKEFFSLEKKRKEYKSNIKKLMKKLYYKRKVVEKKIRKCENCKEKKELDKKLKAVNKLIKKAKKIF